MYFQLDKRLYLQRMVKLTTLKRLLLSKARNARKFLHIMQVWWLPDGCHLPDKCDNCLTTAWQLPDNCLTTSRQLPDNYLTIAWHLPDTCLTTAWQLTDNYQQLPDNCLKTAHQLLTTTRQLSDQPKQGLLGHSTKIPCFKENYKTKVNKKV